MNGLLEKRPWGVFFEELNMIITDYMKKYSQYYRELNEEKQRICEKYPEFSVLYDYDIDKGMCELKLSNEAGKNLARLIELEMEMLSMIQEIYFFVGWREGMELSELTKEMIERK